LWQHPQSALLNWLPLLIQFCYQLLRTIQDYNRGKDPSYTGLTILVNVLSNFHAQSKVRNQCWKIMRKIHCLQWKLFVHFKYLLRSK
jgi:hypothetical protein